MSEQVPTIEPASPQPSMLHVLPLALLRIVIGWHFAYEGVAKLLNPTWTAEGYLRAAEGPLAGVFHWMASNPGVLRWVDLLNAWGLLLIGAALMFGCLTRLAAVAGIVLLALYYIAYPPLFAGQPGVAEGSYLIVNKNLVELAALVVVALLPASRLGLDGILFGRRRRNAAWQAPSAAQPAEPPPEPAMLARRQLLASMTGLPFVGALSLAVLRKHGYVGVEEEQLVARLGLAGGGATPGDGHLDATTSPSNPRLVYQTLDDLEGKVPSAPLGGVRLSRIVMGGNLMNGFAHARDLIYVSNLIKSYHNEWRVFETFRIAEACGINAILSNVILAPTIQAYWEKAGGKIQFVAQCKGKDDKALLDEVKYAIDHGACAAYIQGMAGDTYVEQGRFDWIVRGLQAIRDAGLPAGIGGHYIETIEGCVAEGIEPDFWMKTLHHHDYWSARHAEQKDNIWCDQPQRTIELMASLPQPWIAFKVLAAGSIPPRDGFRYAFENGADFLCVGMYDFQVVEDANIALEVLAATQKRPRRWLA
jgi:uncharacterized membrane protein YphA (DoxX/SURF4 family)